MNLDKDQPYIDRTLKGDVSAFTILVERYKHMVFTLALRMVKNREEAEEIAQDTFLKVYNALGSFKGDSKLSTWIYKIAYYRSLDYLKKIKRNPGLGPIDGIVENSAVSDTDIMFILDQNDKKLAIKDALESLAGDDAIVLTLHYLKELSLQEIGEIMQINANTVKVKLHRARKRLQKILIASLEPEILSSYVKK